MTFLNKNIVITGASKGLGYHVALDFASRGANLALISRDEESLKYLSSEIGVGNKHIYETCDLLDVDETDYSAKKILNHFDNRVDIILHSAGGGYGMRDPLLSSNDLHSLFMGNIGGAVNINRILIPSMIKRKSGNVIHVGSVASREVTGSVGYNTVKSAINAYVRTIGKEMSKFGIVVTGILPGGFIAKDNAMIRLRENKLSVYDEFINQRLPRGFMGNVEELLPMIRLLSSSDASMMGGCMVPIDAGEGSAY